MLSTDLIKNLLIKGQLNFLIDIFIQLDVKSLISCLDVCKLWRDFVQNYVLNIHRKTILRRAWSQLNSESFDYQEVLLNGSISHLTSYHDATIYVSYTNGKFCKITEEKQENVRTDINLQGRISPCSSQIKVGEDIELIEIHGRRRNQDEVTTLVFVMEKNTDKILYSTEITKDNVTTFVWGNSVFIRNLSSSSLEELVFRADSKEVLPRWHCPASSCAVLATDQYLVLSSSQDLRLRLFLRGDTEHPVLTSEVSSEVRDLTSRASSLIIQSDRSLSLLILPSSPPPAGEITTRLRLETSERILSVKHNWWVVAVLELHHQVQLYPWSHLQGEDEVVRPISRLSLPTVAGPHTLVPGPAFTLTDQAIICAERGSNRLHQLSVWQHRLG